MKAKKWSFSQRTQVYPSVLAFQKQSAVMSSKSEAPPRFYITVVTTMYLKFLL